MIIVKRFFKIIIIVLFVSLFFSSLYFVKMNAYAEEEDEVKNDGTCTNVSAIYRYYNITSNYNNDNKTVTLHIENGNFIITHLESISSDGNSSIISTNYSSRDDFIEEKYKDRNINHITIEYDGNYKDVFTGDELVLNYTNGGTIKIGLAYFSDSKDEPDKVTGCYSFDADSNKPKFQTYFERMKPTEGNADEFVGTGEYNYIEIDIPDINAKEKKIANENINGICGLLNNVDFDFSKYPDLANYRSKIIGSTNAERREKYSQYLSYCWDEYVSYNYDEESLKSIIKNVIDIVYKLNNKRDVAIEPTTFTQFKAGSILVDSKNLGTLSCNYKGTTNSNDTSLNVYLYNEESATDKYKYNIDANKKKYRYNSSDIKQATYTYNYTSGETYSETKDVCSVDCEEVIEIKYGPPIASVAGFCFEYEVEAKSMVNCKSTIKPGGYPYPGNYCSPIPYCNSYPGYVHQGGANEEFDKCINICDGGKYTKECSDKCYNSVYSSNTLSNQSFNNNYSLTATKLNSPFNKSAGKYIYSGGNIVWRGRANPDTAPGYARYYLENEPYRTEQEHGSYTYDKNGFKRRDYGYSLCNDSCYFSGCSDFTYLNWDELQKDYAANVEKYNATLNECNSSSSCSSKTSTFKININYNTGETVVVDKSDSLKTNSNGSCTNEIKKKDNVIKAFDGCYQKCDNSKEYMTRWGTPGTWFNIKETELSYSEKNSTGWYLEKERFCLPRSQKNVNVGWWNYYYSLNSSNLSENKKYTDELSNCSNSIASEKILKADYDDVGEIDWNIKASSEEFGYTGWNFDIRCFYASFTCPRNCLDGNCDEQYRIRSFDNLDMFPSENGTAATDSDVPSRSSLGFNWSSDAVSITKNSKYPINPTQLISITQQIARNGGIYNEDYLDYEVTLNPGSISKIRESVTNYTSPNGSYKVDSDTGIKRYYSDFLSKKIINGQQINNVIIKRPNEKLLTCNNIDKNDCLKS